MSQDPAERTTGPHTVPASLPEGADPASQILDRLRAHGAKGSRYVHRGEVARGGMGVVLRVWDEDLRREMAMKVVLGESGTATLDEIPPKMMGRFLEEAQVTGQLDHPGIVPVHELGLDERGAVFFTMRLVKGSDLKEVFERVHAGDSEWTRTRVLWVLQKVCEAMAYAHSKGVIHRDLKPANVMVGRFGEAYVMDWGLARVVGQPDRHDLRVRPEKDEVFSMVESERRADASHSSDSLLFTMDGDVVGTPAFMAPEQARGEIENLGPRSDVYSLGAMLYQLLTGEMPYVTPGARISQHLVLRWVLEGAPRPIHELRADVAEELAAICEKAMARDPAQRYSDMGEMGADLRAYLENRVVQAHKRGAWVELKKWVQRNRALAIAWVAAALLALLGLGATTWVQVRGRRVAEEARALAQANEERANLNLAEAQRQEALARRERSNVFRLSAFLDLEELQREAEGLWPAVPARAPELRRWLTRAAALVQGLEEGDDGGLGHRQQLEELRRRAPADSPAQRAEAIAAHPRGEELLRLERRVDSLRMADAVRRGRRQADELELEAFPEDPAALSQQARALVDPAREDFGREAEGLAMARLAVEATPSSTSYLALDTLAWAQLANGLDAEALESGRAVLAAAPPVRRAEYEESLTRLAQAIQFARSTEGEDSLREAERSLADLEREVIGRSGLQFVDEDDRWWYGQLAELVRGFEDFADPVEGLIRGTSPRYGWGIERRLEYARTLEGRSLNQSEVRALWETARDEVRSAFEYDELELLPQLGLVPLGADPDSGLQEFADLATGDVPRRDDRGRLELGPESALVFVLLPGGEAHFGAQGTDPAAMHYDPDALPDEAPVHRFELDPFFLSKCEMTQGQWARFTARAPSKHLAGTVRAGRDLNQRSPVERVSWFEATRQLARLGWSLPTEAQWEYAARAGTESPWWTGEDVESLQGIGNLADRFAKEHDAGWPDFEPELDDGHLVHAVVGSFEPNPFGLHDMTGNVFEWCRDDFESYTWPASPGDGLRQLEGAPTRVVRGGSYASSATKARSSRRDAAVPALISDIIGLRPARPLQR